MRPTFIRFAPPLPDRRSSQVIVQKRAPSAPPRGGRSAPRREPEGRRGPAWRPPAFPETAFSPGLAGPVSQVTSAHGFPAFPGRSSLWLRSKRASWARERFGGLTPKPAAGPGVFGTVPLGSSHTDRPASGPLSTRTSRAIRLILFPEAAGPPHTFSGRLGPSNTRGRRGACVKGFPCHLTREASYCPWSRACHEAKGSSGREVVTERRSSDETQRGCPPRSGVPGQGVLGAPAGLHYGVRRRVVPSQFPRHSHVALRRQ